VNAGLGQRLRVARLAKGLSLRATAAEASVSASLLSQVETGKVQPSVSTLWSIVSVLGLSVDEVLEGTPAPAAAATRPRAGDPVQHPDAAPLITMENGVTWQRLAVMDPDGDVDAVLATYEPGGASSVDGAHMRHKGVEYGYILEGELTLKIDFDTYPLRAGDSFCFDSRRPHFYVNGTDRVAKGIWYVVGRGTESAAGEGGGPVRSVVEALEAMSRMPGTVSPRGAAG
jgi:transcriptional regulator with XRE-family HTH domain